MDKRRNIFTGKRTPVFIIADCAICQERHDTFKDNTGLSWCKRHKKRGLLLNYGKANNWPAIQFRGQDGTLYAIGAGNDEDLWKVAAILGKEEMIDAAMAYLDSIVALS